MRSKKVGIFICGQNGDICTATSVLKYREQLWPNHEIIWYCNMPMADMLKHNIISEIRHWPNGWELPERCKVDGPLDVAKGNPMWEDWSILKTENNTLNQKLKYNFESTKDLDIGYFPAPWQMSVEKRHGIDYPNISRKVFGVDSSWEWHPYLGFSKEEVEMVRDFCSTLPHSKTIMMETFLGSGVFSWNDNMTLETMKKCRDKFGKCNFIFASHIDNSKFKDDIGVVSCSHFTVRQCALVVNYCDLFVGIGSGISCATSAWGCKNTQKIQYTGSFIGSTKTLSIGPIEMIYTDPPNSNSEQRYYQKLTEVLQRIK